MSNTEYDLDSSGGLMSQVQGLIAPPLSEDTCKNKKKEGLDLHPYYRRPGKGHNHDSCDACGEGGNLLCCDKCPASFHLECHDPPLEDTDIPVGQWVCHQCKCLENPSTTVEKDETEENEDADVNISSRARRAKGRAAKKKLYFEAEKLKKSMNALTQDAATSNPVEFELPPPMLVPVLFPGTDKAGPSQPSTRRSSGSSRKKSYELDAYGLVPLPAKVCFECKKSCRKAPLIACDYCPLLFHQDCLNPPLTSLPVGRWMCPNHVQHFVDDNLVKSGGLTERVKLWTEYSAPIDQDAIKLDFLRKTHRRNPPFNYKVRLAPRGTVVVPEAVKELYEKRVDKTPTLEHTNVDKNLSLLPEVVDLNENETSLTPKIPASVEEQELILSTILQMHLDFATHMTLVKSKGDTNVDNLEYVNNKSLNSSNLTNSKPVCDNLVYNGFSNNDDVEIEPYTMEVETEQSTEQLTNGDTNMEYVNDVTSNHIDYQKITNLELPATKDHNESYLMESKEIKNFLLALQTLPETWDGDNRMNLLSDRMVKLLAYQRLCQMIPPSSTSTAGSIKTIKSNHSLNSSPTGDLTPLSYYRGDSSPSFSSVITTSPNSSWECSPIPISQFQSRAALIPAASKSGKPILMQYRTLTIGSGINVDVSLNSYGTCFFTSPLHAKITYNEMERTYEIINYSDFGIYVNDIFFGYDYAKRKKKKEMVLHGIKRDLKNARNNRKTRKCNKTKAKDAKDDESSQEPYGSNSSEFLNSPCMSSNSLSHKRVMCRCRIKSPAKEKPSTGWENSSPLHHGSVINIGCIQFIFCELIDAIVGKIDK